MKPLILTISCLVGIFLLLPIFSWLAAFKPVIIATICILGLIALSVADNWRHYASSIDEGLDFDTASADAEKQPLIKDPMVGGSDDTTKSGGGLVHHRPPSQNFNTRKIQNTETKCISAGSGAGASRVGNITQRGAIASRK